MRLIRELRQYTRAEDTQSAEADILAADNADPKVHRKVAGIADGSSFQPQFSIHIDINIRGGEHSSLQPIDRINVKVIPDQVTSARLYKRAPRSAAACIRGQNPRICCH